MVDAFTDNRNRTSASIRHRFSKFGGNLAESNAVGWMFERKGVISADSGKNDPEEVGLAAIEAGADDVQSGELGHDIFCKTEDLNDVREALEKQLGPPLSARFIWRPQTSVTVDGDTADTLIKLIEALDDHDDVQQVYANFEMSDAALAKLTA